jgi:hypothetical protein
MASVAQTVAIDQRRRLERIVSGQNQRTLRKAYASKGTGSNNVVE